MNKKQSKSLISILLLATAISAHAESWNITNAELDYIDDGVRVIIPKVLPMTVVSASDKISYTTPGIKAKRPLSEMVCNEYVAQGYDAAPKTLSRSFGKSFGQELAFAGNADQLEDLNFHKDDISSSDATHRVAGGLIRGLSAFAAGRLLGLNTTGSVVGAGEVVATGPSDAVQRDMAVKKAMFDNYKDIPAKNGDAIEIYAVSANGKDGNIIFITEKAQVDDKIVARGIIKAQNIVKQ
jgi:hypothetical protein